MSVCRICANTDGNRIFHAREMMFGLGDCFDYFQCGACGCLQIGEIPSNDAMLKYYPSNYYSYEPPIARSGLRRRLAMVRNRYAIRRKGLLGRLVYSRFPNPPLKCLGGVPMPLNARILDVGCGSGNLLRALRQLGYRNLVGVDPFIEKDVTYEDGVTVLKRTIFDINPGWDVIMFHHSFEHVPNPLETLRGTAAVLAAGGQCVIRIPVADCVAWKTYGVNWVQLDAPRHFHLHTQDSMRILARNAGLEVVQVVHDSSSFQFWGSEQYHRGIALRDQRSYAVSPGESIFKRAEMKEFERRAMDLNRTGGGDQAVFYLSTVGKNARPSE